MLPKTGLETASLYFRCGNTFFRTAPVAKGRSRRMVGLDDDPLLCFVWISIPDLSKYKKSALL